LFYQSFSPRGPDDFELSAASHFFLNGFRLASSLKAMPRYQALDENCILTGVGVRYRSAGKSKWKSRITTHGGKS